jgi:hypothetical protein
MEDRTPIYMLVIVAIVAVVGIIVMMTNTAPTTSTLPVDNMMTGNAIAGQATSATLFGKLFFTVFLFGIAGYMYFSKQE